MTLVLVLAADGLLQCACPSRQTEVPDGHSRGEDLDGDGLSSGDEPGG
ncbi:MAG: hypothetical protein IPO93_12495 [Actinobacteria bacterium]|jgi:hypothetical protein|nr:hypothetical protein [Actinomycetota bacterium]